MFKSYARIFRFLFARLTLMLGSQMRQSRREGAPMTGDDEKDGAKRVEPARPSKKSTEEVLYASRGQRGGRRCFGGWLSITTRCDGTRRRLDAGCPGESFVWTSSGWG